MGELLVPIWVSRADHRLNSKYAIATGIVQHKVAAPAIIRIRRRTDQRRSALGDVLARSISTMVSRE
jgi:hypothetical protein